MGGKNEFTTSLLPSMSSDSSARNTGLTISDDGYVRLCLVELQGISMSHMISGLDDDLSAQLAEGAWQTTITGYTEWVSTTSPIISVGWDWQMHDAQRLFRVGEPRSNLLLLDGARMDMSYPQCCALLEAFVDAMDWQAAVREQIVARYRWQKA